MKVLFMGTPEFAVSSLNALLASKHEVVGVVTQPDRAVKRGKSESSAVKHKDPYGNRTIKGFRRGYSGYRSVRAAFDARRARFVP